MISIVNEYGENKDDFASLAGPGYFNDADEVFVFFYVLFANMRLVN
jgi:hypothetical protein